jgi:prepilin peptidase CpaA
MDTALQNAAVAGFCFCLLWAAMSDARGFVIPNRAVIGIVALFPVHLLARFLAGGAFAPPLSDGLFAFALAGIVLLAGFGLFTLQLMGGGDAKLAAAVALWAGPDHLFLFLVAASMAGGLIAAGMLIWHAAFTTTEEQSSKGTFAVRLQRGLKDPVPFGIAIAAGGLLVAAKLIAG